MELRHLESFLAVYEHGSFRGAAEAAHLAQPAVSRRIQALERELRRPLFTRSRQGAEPTAAGRVLYARVAPLLRELIQAVDDVRDGSEHTERLRVGYVASAIFTTVPELMAAIRAELPETRVELYEMPTPRLAQELRAGRLDVAFLFAGEQQDDVERLPIAELHFVVGLPETDPLAKRERIELAELGSRTFVTLARDEPLHARILGLIQTHAPSIQTQEASGSIAVSQLVAAGIGFGAVPDGTPEPPAPGITMMASDPPLPTATLSLAWRGGTTTAALRLAIAHARAHALRAN